MTYSVASERRVTRRMAMAACCYLLLDLHHHPSPVGGWSVVPPPPLSSSPWRNGYSGRAQLPFEGPTMASRVAPTTMLMSSPKSQSDGPVSPPSSSSSSSSSSPFAGMGLNELQTLLREAVRAEDYVEAARLRDAIAEGISRADNAGGGGKGDDARKLKRLSWTGLGTAPWLVERLEALGYGIPTTIQINAFESINAMLLDGDVGGTSPSNDEGGTLEELMERRQLMRANNNPGGTGEDVDNDGDMAVIVSGSTGSGKTLAYMVPTLSTLSESLFRRQRIRVKAEEDVTDAADDLLARVAVTTSPEVRGRPSSGGSNQVGGSGVQQRASMGKGDYDVRSPLALIVVPTRELGVQTATALYELVGGSTKRTATEMGGMANMFKYKGPRGVKIGCILDPKEAETGLKLQTDVAITTPEFLTRLLDEGDVDPDRLRVIAFDEADLALERTSRDDLRRLFSSSSDEAAMSEGEGRGEEDEEDDDDEDEAWDRRRRMSRLTYMVGASVTDAVRDVEAGDGESILPDGRTYLATATSFAPVSFNDLDHRDGDRDGDGGTASLKQLRLHLDPGLVHERVVVPGDAGLLCLCRMLRRELREYSDVAAGAWGESSRGLQRPRVVVFFPDEAEAARCMPKLRDAMWGDHRLCVLLPDTGASPLSVMEDFKSNRTSVMLATPNSVRGLDFAGVTHVYTLYLPADDPREYVHLAGRVGRLGQAGSVAGRGGRVTSILRPEEAEKMDGLANELGFDFVDVEFVKADVPVTVRENEEGELDIEEDASVDDMRRYLEDMITLVGDGDSSGVDAKLEDSSDDPGREEEEGDSLSSKNSGCDI